MSVSTVIVYIMVVFMFIGAIDKAIFHNRFGYGEQFEEGINTMGPLAISMVGIMCLAPVIGKILTPIVAPVFKLVGADSAMFSGSLLAIDMGGYPLAQAMTSNQDIVILSGIILASMLGCTIVFSIPVSLSIIDDADKKFLSEGMMIGIVSIPFGTLAGALIAGLSLRLTLINLIPVAVLAALLAIGLWKVPEKLLKGFSIFSNIITIIIIISFACAIVEGLTGFVIIPGMDPIGEQLETVGTIAITLAGAYPLVHFITVNLSKPLGKIGNVLGINDVAVAGIIASLANSIPTFGMIKDMDNKGKVISVAFAVPAVAALGDHLGYVSANAPQYLLPVVVGKIIAGIIAVIIAMVYLRNDKNSDQKVTE